MQSVSCSCPHTGRQWNPPGCSRVGPDQAGQFCDARNQSLWTSRQPMNVDACILSPTAIEYHPLHCLKEPEAEFQKDVCEHLFIAALFIMAERCEQAGVRPQSKSISYIHTWEYYSAMRLKAVLCSLEQCWMHYTEWYRTATYTIYGSHLTEGKVDMSPQDGRGRNKSHW